MVLGSSVNEYERYRLQPLKVMIKSNDFRYFLEDAVLILSHTTTCIGFCRK